MPKRIVVEASPTEERLLYDYLASHGTSLSEWFSARVAESATTYRLDLEQEASESKLQVGDASPSVASLQSIDWAFEDDDTGYLTHGLHPYPAKFIPQIPRTLISQLSRPGDLVWDPFGGSGTTAVEALLLGRRVISSDVNPLSAVIGLAKTAVVDHETETQLRRLATRLELQSRDVGSLRDVVSENRSALDALVPPIPNADRWFSKTAIDELALIRLNLGRFDEGAALHIAQSVFSRIIVRVSFQDGETRYTSRPRDVPIGSVLRAFTAELNAAIPRVRGFSERAPSRTARFITADLRKEPVVSPGSVDLVVSSPPYPNATDYHLYHRFRLLWLGYSPQDLSKKEIGSHLRHQKEATGIDEYVEEMRACARHIYRGLRPASFAALVVGDAVFEGKTHSTSSLISDVAKDIGFAVASQIERKVHSTRRSFISAARRLRAEMIVVLQKPDRRILVTVPRNPYRLWDYEDRLRERELRALVGTHRVASSGRDLRVTLDATETYRLKRLTFAGEFRAEGFASERTWQSVLENGDAEQLKTRKDPKYAGHGLHAYKGKFYPQLARCMFNLAQLEPGATVLDPFCGSGTVLLESRLNGHRAFGLDLNPLAVQIAHVKTAMLDLSHSIVRHLVRDALVDLVPLAGDEWETAFDPQCVSELQSWFATPVLRKLGAVREAIRDTPNSVIRLFLTVCLSSIVREVSQQDPRDLRIRRRKAPLRDAPVFELFRSRVDEALERHARFRESLGFMPWRIGTAKVQLNDARDPGAFASVGVAARSVDAVVTSPPYATALPYIDTDRLSLAVLFGVRQRDSAEVEYRLTGSRDITTRDRRELENAIERHAYDSVPSAAARDIISAIYRLNKSGDVGFRRKNQAALLYRYYADMWTVLQNLDACLKPHGSAFMVIGDNRTEAGGHSVRVASGKVLREMGGAMGWELEDAIPITVTKEARPHSRNSITVNEILWFRKP